MNVAIVGHSGTGKSTSIGKNDALGIKGLDPKETLLINVANKPLPFRGWKKLYNAENRNYLQTDDPEKIVKAINQADRTESIKNIVLDDGQYIMAFDFMRRANETGYGKFAKMGVNMGKIVEASKNTRDDLKVYFLWHPEVTGDSLKMKTVGNMVDQYLTLEGLFTIQLYTKVEIGNDNKPHYHFITNNDGEYPAKSPFGMFETLTIPNDLGLVSELIDAYNNGDDE